MIIYLDGPEKAGKTTLVSSICDGFNSEQIKRVKWTGRAKQNGFEYYSDFIQGLTSQTIQVWDRGWISESIYGRLLNQDRLFSSDQFIPEWYFGRMLNARGGKFILLPYDMKALPGKRDDTDLDVSPYLEYAAFRDYANSWGYKILYNNYEWNALDENSKTARKSILIGTHSYRLDEYIGPKDPLVTFVAEFPTSHDKSLSAPFYDQVSMGFFHMFGASAISRFGYTTIENWEIVNSRRFIAVGDKAREVISREIGYVPLVPDLWEMNGNLADRSTFWERTMQALDYFNISL